MDSNLIIQGALFTRDYLETAIRGEPGWEELSADALAASLAPVFERFPAGSSPNESQTEDDLIWPVLEALGWTCSLRQQNLAPSGRADVPDGLLFLDQPAKDRANACVEEWRRYGFGAALVESKRWDRPLDRRSPRRSEGAAPSTQMLRYLRRADDLTEGGLRWGILTNGAVWRLYYQGARSVSDDYFQVDLAGLLGVAGGRPEGVDGPGAGEARDHWLKVFASMFRREAFAPSPSDARTFHQRALDEGKYYEERVARNLSDKVFETVFPSLARGLADSVPDASLDEVRDAALVLLYRLLFLLFAEDRNLLPVRDSRYDDYGLRDRVRGDVGRRKDMDDAFSTSAARYWAAIADLSRAIDEGDGSIGLPPYDGGLFDAEATPLLARARLADDVMAEAIDLLSFERVDGRRRYINYRDLSVQQLGSIYERLLEFELRRDPGGGLVVRPNPFARKSSGSYYTPDELVRLILGETLEPLISDRLDAFRNRAAELADDGRSDERRLGILKCLDPAEAILELRICDPAMGSGHFLVNLVDFLADSVVAAMAEAEALVDWGGDIEYVSPLAERIATVRRTMEKNAEDNDWAVGPDQFDDRHVIRRMVLKRCVYGVDKNPMAVELAKVSLWLHTFTVGAPLSFLDHHLRCGDSLFGEWVADALRRLNSEGLELLINGPLRDARSSAASMHSIERLTDAEIAEAHLSADIFGGVVSMTGALNGFLAMLHAIEWLDLRGRDDKAAVQAWLDGQFGNPVEIARGALDVLPATEDEADPPGDGARAAPEAPPVREEALRFADILDRARALIAEERFLNWEVALPGVWKDWEGDRTGGFDAVVGNPPWDRLKLQQVEWFAARDPGVAKAPRAADRKRMIRDLEEAGDPLAAEYAEAARRAEAASRVARGNGRYPLLSGGDTNLNSLFVEQAARLIAPDGVVGLLIPSGIATETSSQAFFSSLIEGDRAKACIDFFNRRRDGDLFFPDVYYRFKFSAFVFGGAGRRFDGCRFATFVRDVDELRDEGRLFTLDLDHFRHVSPNSVTAPVYRSRRDQEIASAVYDRLPVLSLHEGRGRKRTYPVKYVRMFDMANDSARFRTHAELKEAEGAWRNADGTWESGNARWAPLYEGKMVQAFDHRASGIATVEENLYRTGQAAPASGEQHADPSYRPEPRYFVEDAGGLDWEVAVKDVTSTTNARSIIACAIPPVAAGHTLPLLRMEEPDAAVRASHRVQLLANLNSVALDFVARTKILGNHASWFILEQLPVVPPRLYEETAFGPKTAAEIVRECVLELTYVSHDLAPFARDMGHVDAAGEPLAPFPWDEERRLRLRARLDAVFFHLYGIFDPADRGAGRDRVGYVYSTFPVVERKEVRARGSYRSRDLALAWCNALAADKPDAEPEE